MTRTTRRTFIGGLTAAAVGVPTLLRAQPRPVKIGMVCPVSGPMADVGQDSRLGAQLAVEAINAAGGVKSLGGARLELLTADSETKADVARSEADRLINAGAQIMTGAFHSAHVATISLLAQQRRVPYVIDISAADAPTANAARSVREGQQKTQYVYRIFPGSATFGRNAVRYMTEIFRTFRPGQPRGHRRGAPHPPQASRHAVRSLEYCPRVGQTHPYTSGTLTSRRRPYDRVRAAHAVSFAEGHLA